MSFKSRLQKYIHGVGYHLSKYNINSHPIARRKAIIDHNGITCVLDVGANVGDYVDELRGEIAYKDRIISFEPITEAFDIINKKYAQDRKWQGRKIALGDRAAIAEINISKNLASSSISGMLSRHEDLEPSAGYIKKELIQVNTLDEIWSDLNCDSDRVMLKLDVQGYERYVIEGARESLNKISIVQMEMSLVQLYENELLFNDMLNLMKSNGFRLISIEPGFCDQISGELIQVDGIFSRDSS